MRAVALFLVLSLVASSGFGCAGQAKLVRALAKDPATVDLKVSTPWGSSEFHRSVPVCPNCKTNRP